MEKHRPNLPHTESAQERKPSRTLKGDIRRAVGSKAGRTALAVGASAGLLWAAPNHDPVNTLTTAVHEVGKPVVDILLPANAERLKECVVINEPLGNRTLSDIATEKADQIGVDPADLGAITTMTHLLQEYGGPGALPFEGASTASAERNVDVEICAEPGETIPVRIFSPDK